MLLHCLFTVDDSLTIVSLLGIDYSSTAHCLGPDVGYTFNPSFLGIDTVRDRDRIVIKTFSGSLIINALAAAFAGFSLFFGFFAWLCASRAMEIVSSTCHAIKSRG